jgi:hypothetical protein
MYSYVGGYGGPLPCICMHVSSSREGGKGLDSYNRLICWESMVKSGHESAGGSPIILAQGRAAEIS